MYIDLHLLVVNDSPTLRHVIVSLLKELGYVKISEAADGAMALRTFKAAKNMAVPIHFVVTDCSMPIMDGLTLIRSIRDTPALSELPILMITAVATEENILAAAKAGADGYVVKPLGANALKKRINSILKKREMNDYMTP
ncbi:MAG: response regulator [Pseudomonadota bacterium]